MFVIPTSVFYSCVFSGLAIVTQVGGEQKRGEPKNSRREGDSFTSILFWSPMVKIFCLLREAREQACWLLRVN